MARQPVGQIVIAWLRSLRKRGSLVAIALVVSCLTVLRIVSDAPDDGRSEQTPPQEDFITDAAIMKALKELDHRISVVRSPCSRLVQLGGKVMCYCDTWHCTADGAKLMCLDDDVRPSPRRCFALNFGIGFDLSFDEALVQYGCRVAALDPTNPNITNKMHQENFHALGIGLDDKDYTLTLDMTYDNKNYVKATAAYMTYESVLQTLDRPRVDLLKMDIEGYEWRVLKQVLSSPNATSLLKDVRQILLEIHLDFLLKADGVATIYENVLDTLQILRQLEDFGFVLAAFDLNETRQQYFVFNGYEIAVFRELTLVRRPLARRSNLHY
ncbi:uncharacterized protein LOC122246342 [Penaeus japonicus]|uniref:uncharacterized protein LOC122246342 n=1 Tax=Penaeus japonicus TaxID=27405 RepID=UPI001C70F31A|nr:uncharacterized protein LOC122246342 [Penaeus japonicus]